MYNQNLHSRTHHPHLYAPKDSQRKSSRSKIELTHLHHPSKGEDRSNYSTNVINTQAVKSQYHPQSTDRERSSVLQQSKGDVHVNKQLYLLMKEQIDISAFNFREKMNNTLKAQAQEIQKLSSVIAYNAKLIQKQQEIIKKMHHNDENMTNTIRSRVSGREEPRTPSKSPGKISLTQRKSVQKLLSSRREVSPLKGQPQPPQVFTSKLNTLIGIVDDLDKRLYDYAVKNRETINRVKEVQRKVASEMWKKLKKCEDMIKAYLEVNQQKMSRIQKDIDSKSLESKDILGKLRNLTEESQELKSLIFNLANREFNYDSYQLNILRQDLHKISQKVNALAGEHFFKEKNYKQSQKYPQKTPPHALTHSYSMINQRFGDPFQNIEFRQSELEKSQLSCFSQYKPKHYSEVEDRVRQSQDWSYQRNSAHMSDEDEFYFEQSEAEKEERSRKLNKLIQILKKSGYTFPVRVQIDGTGYLKEISTGIYILDEHDNGFELSPEQIQILKVNGIIRM